jgi:hypothetical protein
VSKDSVEGGLTAVTRVVALVVLVVHRHRLGHFSGELVHEVNEHPGGEYEAINLCLNLRRLESHAVQVITKLFQPSGDRRWACSRDQTTTAVPYRREAGGP